jgi:hypothetical protein
MLARANLQIAAMRRHLIISIVFWAAAVWVSPAWSQTLERGVPPCSKEKVAAARDGAERNSPASIYALARYYSTGKCIAGDGVEAIKLYRRAADLGYPAAYYNLGIIAAANGDYRAAETSWLRGASLGHRGSELQLGILYSWPQLDVADDVKSYAWLSLAAAQGGAGLGIFDLVLEKVIARLSTADLAKARLYLATLRRQYRAVPAASAMPAETRSELEAGFSGALRGCEAWVLDPKSWANGIGPFVALVGLGDKMGLVDSIDEHALPPPRFRTGNRYLRINATLGAGYILVVSDKIPMCHITGGGNVDLQPVVDAVLASKDFASRWEMVREQPLIDMVSTIFRNRQKPSLSIVISRSQTPGQRLDRVQVQATAGELAPD